MAYKKTKNLLGSRDTYNRYYGDFRGVDFSSDHTQVHAQRFAYLVNMYKDYGTGQGQAVETIPGFRRRFEPPTDARDKVYGIHQFVKKEGSESRQYVLVHIGKRLFLWNNYPGSVNILMEKMVAVPKSIGKNEAGQNIYTVEDIGDIVVKSVVYRGEPLIILEENSEQKNSLSFVTELELSGELVTIKYFEGEIASGDALKADMNSRKSASFVFNNRLYIIDGKNYIYFDGEKIHNVMDEAYIPTTFINIIPGGDNRNEGEEHEQRNLLQPAFRHTFYGDGETKDFFMNEEIEAVTEVKVYGKVMIEEEDYTVEVTEGKISFTTAPSLPSEAEYPENYAGVEITARKRVQSEKITGCTLVAVYDERVFLSGNPAYPNNVYFCGRNQITGFIDPSYFPVTSYVPDGVGTADITGMLVVADTLMVLKSDTQQDGSVYFHTPTETGDSLYPKIYNSTRGLAGIGCLGACINFLDDPVFVSRLGLEAVGQLSTRLERAIEHRSSLVDAKLVNMDLRNAVLEEWNGYLVLLVDGKIFLADSRQRYTHEIGVMQYEWYYLEDIGVYDGQYPEYVYSTSIHDEFKGKKVKWCCSCKNSENKCACGKDDRWIELELKLATEVYDGDTDEYKNLVGTVVNPPDEEGKMTGIVGEGIMTFELIDEGADGEEQVNEYDIPVFYSVHEVKDKLSDEVISYEAYLCENKGQHTGGVYDAAVMLKSLDGNLFFGTGEGVICSFNFDKRNEQGEIPTSYYNFDNRTIYCGVATKMDCCDIPHLTKNTVKKSTIIKTKALSTSAAKIKVRTNKKAYEQIARINSSVFSFDNADFDDYSFILTEQSLFSIKEKEKKWVEKQYYIYSDEYGKPFSLYYIAFRYSVAGRYKE